jgi:hypothetical protein
MIEDDIPPRHLFTHSLDLATDEIVILAWTEFFRECRRLAALARQRRAERGKQNAEEPNEQRA